MIGRRNEKCPIMIVFCPIMIGDFGIFDTIFAIDSDAKRSECDMTRHREDRPTERQRRNLQFAEDRIDLLEDIREMIDVELDRLSIGREHAPHPRSLLLAAPSGSAPWSLSSDDYIIRNYNHQ